MNNYIIVVTKTKIHRYHNEANSSIIIFHLLLSVFNDKLCGRRLDSEDFITSPMNFTHSQTLQAKIYNKSNINLLLEPTTVFIKRYAHLDNDSYKKHLKIETTKMVAKLFGAQT